MPPPPEATKPGIDTSKGFGATKPLDTSKGFGSGGFDTSKGFGATKPLDTSKGFGSGGFDTSKGFGSGGAQPSGFGTKPAPSGFPAKSTDKPQNMWGTTFADMMKQTYETPKE